MCQEHYEFSCFCPSPSALGHGQCKKILSTPEVSATDLHIAASRYEDGRPFHDLTEREQQIVSFLDTICPMMPGKEETVDLQPGLHSFLQMWHRHDAMV